MSKKFSFLIGFVCAVAAVPARADEDREVRDTWRTSAPEAEPEDDQQTDEVWGPPPGAELADGEQEEDEAALDARLRMLGRNLESVQKGRRRYFTSWMVISTGLIGGQAVLVREEDQPGVRAGYLSSIGLATASIGLQLLRLGPGLTAFSRFSRMPSRSIEEKKAKLTAGEGWLASQASVDRKATSWLAHCMGAGAAVASGVLLSLLYENNLKEGLRRLFGTFIISELTILTRPIRAISYYEEYTNAPSRMDLALAPWMSLDAYGLGLNGRF